MLKPGPNMFTYLTHSRTGTTDVRISLPYLLYIVGLYVLQKIRNNVSLHFVKTQDRLFVESALGKRTDLRNLLLLYDKDRSLISKQRLLRLII